MIFVFSNNSSYLSQIRFSPNQAYRTTKSGKQQIGPENSNLFIAIDGQQKHLQNQGLILFLPHSLSIC